MRNFTSFKSEGKRFKETAVSKRNRNILKTTCAEFCRLVWNQVLEISSPNGYFDHNFYSEKDKTHSRKIVRSINPYKMQRFFLTSQSRF